MKPTKKINPYNLYVQTLSAMDYVIDDSAAAMREGKELVNITVNDKELYLPSEALLKKNKWKDIQPYHPLSENSLRGQSPVLQHLIRDMEVWATINYCKILDMIIKVISNDDLQAELIRDVPEITKLLSSTANGATDKTASNWKKLLKHIEKERLRVVRLYIARKAKHDDEVYQRVGTVSFPLTENFEEKSNELVGVKFSSITQRDVLLNVIKYIENKLTEVFTSNGSTPYYHVVLQFQRNLVTVFNEIYSLFESKFPVELIDDSWFEAVDSLDSYMGVIPPLPGNDGETIKHGVDSAGFYEASKPRTRPSSRDDEDEGEERSRRDREYNRDRTSRRDRDDYRREERRDSRDRYDDYDDRRGRDRDEERDPPRRGGLLDMLDGSGERDRRDGRSRRDRDRYDDDRRSFRDDYRRDSRDRYDDYDDYDDRRSRGRSSRRGRGRGRY